MDEARPKEFHSPSNQAYSFRSLNFNPVVVQVFPSDQRGQVMGIGTCNFPLAHLIRIIDTPRPPGVSGFGTPEPCQTIRCGIQNHADPRGNNGLYIK